MGLLPVAADNCGLRPIDRRPLSLLSVSRQQSHGDLHSVNSPLGIRWRHIIWCARHACDRHHSGGWLKGHPVKVLPACGRSAQAETLTMTLERIRESQRPTLPQVWQY